MSYRNLTVGGKKYRYAIGLVATKVQEIGQKQFTLYDNETIGHRVQGMSRKKKGTCQQVYFVGPGDVARAIEGKPVDVSRCSHGTVTTEFAINPFDAEIRKRTTFMINCNECVHEMAMEI